MTSPLPRDVIEQLTPLLGSLARLVASGSDLSEGELKMLFLGGGLEPEPAAVEELKRWGRVLTAVRQDPSVELRRAAVEGLKLRGLPEAPVLLAVSTVTEAVPEARASPPASRAKKLTCSVERLEFGTLASGRSASLEFEVRGGPGRVVVDSDQVKVTPSRFGPDRTRIEVEAQPRGGDLLWTALKLVSAEETLEVPVLAQWEALAPSPPPKAAVKPAIQTSPPKQEESARPSHKHARRPQKSKPPKPVPQPTPGKASAPPPTSVPAPQKRTFRGWWIALVILGLAACIILFVVNYGAGDVMPATLPATRSAQAQPATMTGEVSTETAVTPQATTIILTALPSPAPTIVVVEIATAIATSAIQVATDQPGPGFMGITPPDGSTMATTQSQTGIIAGVTPADVPPTAILQGTERLAPIASPITGVTLARRLDKSQKPVEPTNVFEQTDTFFCSVEVTSIEAGSQVAARWYYGEESLDQFALTTDTGSGHLGFNLAAVDGTWPIGNYRVEIAFNDIPAKAAAFSVKTPDEAIPSRAKSAIMTRSVDNDHRATEPSLAFLPTDTIHCSVNADLGLGSQLTAKWYNGGQLMAEYLTTATAKENMSDTYVDFYLAPSNPLAPGPYSIEILLDGQLARAMAFTVQGARPATVPAAPTPALPEPLPTPEPPPELESFMLPGSTVGPISFSTAVIEDHQAILPRSGASGRQLQG